MVEKELGLCSEIGQSPEDVAALWARRRRKSRGGWRDARDFSSCALETGNPAGGQVSTRVSSEWGVLNLRCQQNTHAKVTFRWLEV
jgi:hypothetical protein